MAGFSYILKLTSSEDNTVLKKQQIFSSCITFILTMQIKFIFKLLLIIGLAGSMISLITASIGIENPVPESSIQSNKSGHLSTHLRCELNHQGCGTTMATFDLSFQTRASDTSDHTLCEKLTLIMQIMISIIICFCILFEITTAYIKIGSKLMTILIKDLGYYQLKVKAENNSRLVTYNDRSLNYTFNVHICPKFILLTDRYLDECVSFKNNVIKNDVLNMVEKYNERVGELSELILHSNKVDSFGNVDPTYQSMVNLIDEAVWTMRMGLSNREMHALNGNILSEYILKEIERMIGRKRRSNKKKLSLKLKPTILDSTKRGVISLENDVPLDALMKKAEMFITNGVTLPQSYVDYNDFLAASEVNDFLPEEARKAYVRNRNILVDEHNWVYRMLVHHYNMSANRLLLSGNNETDGTALLASLMLEDDDCIDMIYPNPNRLVSATKDKHNYDAQWDPSITGAVENVNIKTQATAQALMMLSTSSTDDSKHSTMFRKYIRDASLVKPDHTMILYRMLCVYYIALMAEETGCEVRWDVNPDNVSKLRVVNTISDYIAHINNPSGRRVDIVGSATMDSKEHGFYRAVCNNDFRRHMIMNGKTSVFSVFNNKVFNSKFDMVMVSALPTGEIPDVSDKFDSIDILGFMMEYVRRHLCGGDFNEAYNLFILTSSRLTSSERAHDGLGFTGLKAQCIHGPRINTQFDLLYKWNDSKLFEAGRAKHEGIEINLPGEISEVLHTSSEQLFKRLYAYGVFLERYDFIGMYNHKGMKHKKMLQLHLWDRQLEEGGMRSEIQKIMSTLFTNNIMSSSIDYYASGNALLTHGIRREKLLAPVHSLQIGSLFKKSLYNKSVIAGVMNPEPYRNAQPKDLNQLFFDITIDNREVALSSLYYHYLLECNHIIKLEICNRAGSTNSIIRHVEVIDKLKTLGNSNWMFEDFQIKEHNNWTKSGADNYLVYGLKVDPNKIFEAQSIYKGHVEVNKYMRILQCTNEVDDSFVGQVVNSLTPFVDTDLNIEYRDDSDMESDGDNEIPKLIKELEEGLKGKERMEDSKEDDFVENLDERMKRFKSKIENVDGGKDSSDEFNDMIRKMGDDLFSELIDDTFVEPKDIKDVDRNLIRSFLSPENNRDMLTNLTLMGVDTREIQNQELLFAIKELCRDNKVVTGEKLVTIMSVEDEMLRLPLFRLLTRNEHINDGDVRLANLMYGKHSSAIHIIDDAITLELKHMADESAKALDNLVSVREQQLHFNTYITRCLAGTVMVEAGNQKILKHDSRVLSDWYRKYVKIPNNSVEEGAMRCLYDQVDVLIQPQLDNIVVNAMDVLTYLKNNKQLKKQERVTRLQATERYVRNAFGITFESLEDGINKMRKIDRELSNDDRVKMIMRDVENLMKADFKDGLHHNKCLEKFNGFLDHISINDETLKGEAISLRLVVPPPPPGLDIKQNQSEEKQESSGHEQKKGETASGNSPQHGEPGTEMTPSAVDLGPVALSVKPLEDKLLDTKNTSNANLGMKKES